MRGRIHPAISVLIGILVLGSAADRCHAQIRQDDWPAGVLPRENLSQDRSYDYDFANVSVRTLKTWLGRIGVELPVELDGELSGWFWVQRSKTGWLDFKNYQVEGEITCPELKIDQWTVAEADLRFGYADGNWFVGNLAGVLQSPGDQSHIGTVSAKAKILTATTSLIELNASVAKVDLESLLRSFGIDLGIKNSRGSVVLDGKIPLATPSDLTTWNATTVFELEDVTTPWIESASEAFVKVQLADGTWKLTDGRIGVAGQELKLAAEGQVVGDLPFEASLTGAKIETSELLRQLKQKELAESLSGAIRLDANVKGSQSIGIEVAAADVESDSLIFQTQPIQKVKLRAGYRPTGIRLDIESAELADGKLTGTATWSDINQLAQVIPSTASLDLDDLNLEELEWLKLPVQLRGQATGHVELGSQLRENASDWSSSGRVQIDGLEVAGTPVGVTKLEWKKSLLADELTAEASVLRGDGSLQSNISLQLGDDPKSLIRATRWVQYRAQGQLENYDVIAQIGKGKDTNVPIHAAGRFDLFGSPENWLERGTVALSNSTAMWGDRRLTLEMADVSISPDEFRLERFRLLDPDGKIAGGASFRRDHQGEHLLKLRVVDVDLKPYVSRFTPTKMQSLDGRIGFELEMRIDANKALSENWSGRWTSNVSELSYKGRSLGNLNLNGEIGEQLLSANIEGQLLGGNIAATLKVPISLVVDNPGSDAQPANLQLKVDALQVERLAGLLLDRQTANDINGTASVMLSAEGTSPQDLAFTAQIQSPMIMSKRNILVRDVDIRVRYLENTLSIDRIAVGFARGRIDAGGQVQFDKDSPFTNVSAGRISFSARRLDATSMMTFITPQYADSFSGAVDYRGTATFHRGIQLRGVATVKNGKLLGFPIQIARGEVKTALGRDLEFRQLVSNDLHGTAIGGKFAAELMVRGGNQISLQTNGRVSRGKLEQLSRALGFSQIIGSGTFDGNFDLNSSQIESLSAINGGLRIDFENGDVDSIPIVSSLDRFVPLAQFASTNIESGRLNARLGQGQLRITDLLLTSKAFWLAASGNASLDGTKLDIDAALQTGGSVQQRLTQSGLDAFLVGTASPLAAITQLNELIRNRSIFVHVGGSPARPVVQAKTGPTAAKAFLQTFSRAAVPTTPVINP